MVPYYPSLIQVVCYKTFGRLIAHRETTILWKLAKIQLLLEFNSLCVVSSFALVVLWGFYTGMFLHVKKNSRMQYFLNVFLSYFKQQGSMSWMWVAHSSISWCWRNTELTQTAVSSSVHCSSTIAFSTIGVVLKLNEGNLQLESPVFSSWS